jgi:phage gpG-like protein
VTPQEMLRLTQGMADRMEAMSKRAAFVGLPKEKVGGKVYGGGWSIIANGASHEYGVPQQGLPQRSFLRAPFRVKAKELNAQIAKEFEHVANGKRDVEVGLGRIGALATNISKGAFTTLGYGAWAPSQKPTGQTLIQTGLLRNSITWVVR